MIVKQNEFAKALFDADMATPTGLQNPDGNAALKRFSVYRNNVAVSLSEALEVTFPVIQKLVGDEFFTAMAGVFLRQHAPSSPILMYYGDEIPAFLDSFKPVAHLGYLADVARIELALCRSYHAGDVPSIDPQTLLSIAPDDLLNLHLELAPCVHLIRSNWPAASLYHANSTANAPPPKMQPEDVLVSRPEFDPEVLTLPVGGGAFVAALKDDKTLGEALAIAGASVGGFDFTAVLTVLLDCKAITKISKGT